MNNEAINFKGGEMCDLKIVYKTENEVNMDFDKALEKVAKEFGYIFYASGYETLTGDRDLCFDKVS